MSGLSGLSGNNIGDMCRLRRRGCDRRDARRCLWRRREAAPKLLGLHQVLGSCLVLLHNLGLRVLLLQQRGLLKPLGLLWL